MVGLHHVRPQFVQQAGQAPGGLQVVVAAGLEVAHREAVGGGLAAQVAAQRAGEIAVVAQFAQAAGQVKGLGGPSGPAEALGNVQYFKFVGHGAYERPRSKYRPRLGLYAHYKGPSFC